MFSSKVHTSLFQSPFVGASGLEICITVPFFFFFFPSILYSSHLRREIKARGVSARVILKPSVRPASSFLNPLPGKEPLPTSRVNIQQQAGPLRDKTSTCGCLKKWGEETFSSESEAAELTWTSDCPETISPATDLLKKPSHFGCTEPFT